MRRLFVFAAVLLALAASISAQDARAQDVCRSYRAGEMAMTINEDNVSVPMTVSGRRVDLVVDTGGVYSMLTEDVVDSLGLRKQSIGAGDFAMWGGAHVHSYVTARDIDLGGLKAAQMSFLVIPNGYFDANTDGMLAPDVLRLYDDDFDFAGGRFALIRSEHCEGKKVYWAKSWSEIGFDLDDDNHIRLPVVLDGHGLAITLDTGADRSAMSLELAESLFGFDEKSPLLKRIETEDGKPVYRYPFASLGFGGVTVANPDILLVPDAISHAAGAGRALLGTGVLRQLHLYISYRERKLYVTAAGAHL